MTHEPRQNFPNPDDLSPDWEDRTPMELDDDRWDAFLPDDDQRDPLPEPGDFWIESVGGSWLSAFGHRPDSFF